MLTAPTLLNPATGAALDAVPAWSTLDDVAAACTRAHRAFGSEWSRNGLLRVTFLNDWADGIEAHAEELAQLLTSETGKVLRESRREIAMTIEALRFNAPLSRHVAGSAYDLADGSAGHLRRQPAGVSAFIIPWNWPVFLLFRDLAPALAAGVTAVVKPAPQTPLGLTRVLELMPPIAEPVVQCVYGGAEVGTALVDDPRVKIVCFTGSTSVGRSVASAASKRFAKPVLELGGKGTNLVFGDADVDRAIAAVVEAGYLTSGQMCMAASRVLVERSVYSRFVDGLTDRVRALRVGDPTDEATSLGPVISAVQGERVTSYVDIARADGHLVTGGSPADVDLDGAYLEPAVIAGEGIDKRILTEEIFGPVVSVEPFDSEEEALARANGTIYGLSAGVWTTDVTRAWHLARELDFGTVWVNRYNRTFAEVPSGGMKESGTGRSRGFEGLHEFTELKHINWEL
ncbi:aldehyde dehydrogenase family protein [Rhodococcus qingshengii]|uniref:aldehyde dehydrogenase family protein n=1 Tax=Rhodococcus qingshengii TaxID=334542 RepID=UPI0022B311EC|nr:aldehyde dehydrogenase family protein [Rhodococcus qingshengii]MCZ4618619.1 aldehyde dehydrogenase family protein [Rhodococcus qingshengii]